jgi:hypothetical protein
MLKLVSENLFNNFLKFLNFHLFIFISTFCFLLTIINLLDKKALGLYYEETLVAQLKSNFLLNIQMYNMSSLHQYY